MRKSRGESRRRRLASAAPASRFGPQFHFTDVPAELRERIIEELRARPEFRHAWEAQAHGTGVSLSLRLPEPLEFAYDGCRFHAFAWMGEIYVLGEKQPPASAQDARS